MIDIDGAPKPMGYLQRVEGIRVNMEHLSDELGAFAAKINGGEDAKAPAPHPAPIGLTANLTLLEQKASDCLAQLAALNEAF